jgi:high-affinity nickel-transport protein
MRTRILTLALVILLIGIAGPAPAQAPQDRFPGLLAVGGVIGTTVSAGFLFIIAMINLVVLAGVYRLFQRVRRGGTYAEDELNVFLAAIVIQRVPLGYKRL